MYAIPAPDQPAYRGDKKHVPDFLDVSMDSAPPKLYTQEDMDNAVASVRAEWLARENASRALMDEYAGRLADAEALRDGALKSARENSNALFNFKSTVGQELQEFFEVADVHGYVTEDRDNLFKRLKMEDYLPKKKWSVEVKITEATSYITVEAPNKEAAMKLVHEEVSCQEIREEINEGTMDYEVVDAEEDK